MKPILRPKSKKAKDKNRAEEMQSAGSKVKKYRRPGDSIYNDMNLARPDKTTRSGRKVRETENTPSGLKDRIVENFKNSKYNFVGRNRDRQAKELAKSRAGEFAGDDVPFPRNKKKGGGMMKKKGMAKGGMMKKKGYAMGGALKGSQSKLDKNKDGKISGDDFKMMKKKGGGMMKKKGMAKGGMMKKKGMAKGGKVRGSGIARQGVRAAKMM